MTKEESIQKFRSMWRTMGKYRMTKSEYFDEFAPEHRGLVGRCYLCEFVASTPGGRCCPIDWSPAAVCISVEDAVTVNKDEVTSLFRLWEIALDMKDRTEMGKLALQIAELPEKIGYGE